MDIHNMLRVSFLWVYVYMERGARSDWHYWSGGVGYRATFIYNSQNAMLYNCSYLVIYPQNSTDYFGKKRSFTLPLLNDTLNTPNILLKRDSVKTQLSLILC